jgi:hypothetical protein
MGILQTSWLASISEIFSHTTGMNIEKLSFFELGEPFTGLVSKRMAPQREGIETIVQLVYGVTG